MNLIEIIECEQGTPEWFKARLGIPTASEFQCLVANSAEHKGRKKYMHRLAGERVSRVPEAGYFNQHMERGKVEEPKIKSLYALEQNIQIRPVGFVLNHTLRAGCSPDGLVGDDGGVEIKSGINSIVVEAKEAGKFPAKHYAQCQGFLLVTGRQWCDLVLSGTNDPEVPPDEQLKPFVMRTERDETYIQSLTREIELFNRDLDYLVDFLQRVE